MQYRNNVKIIIDKRKLDVLIRLGCPDEQLLQIIKTGKFNKTGDKLIDEMLESLYDVREFKNWGGNHNPNGINGCNKKKKRGQVDQQVDGQDGGQDIGQDVDKDKDIDKENNINKKEMYKEKFDEFWSCYPKQRAGSKDKAYASYCRAIKENRSTPEKILEACKNYAVSDEVKRGYAKGCSAWLNDDRFNVQYKTENRFEW